MRAGETRRERSFPKVHLYPTSYDGLEKSSSTGLKFFILIFNKWISREDTCILFLYWSIKSFTFNLYKCTKAGYQEANFGPNLSPAELTYSKSIISIESQDFYTKQRELSFPTFFSIIRKFFPCVLREIHLILLTKAHVDLTLRKSFSISGVHLVKSWSQKR